MQWTFTLEQLPDVAGAFWNYFGDKQVFTLNGPMGAGKTTMIKALCAAKGVADATASPTFSIINEYGYQDPQGKARRIYHLDLYRLKDENDAISAGVEDTLYQDAISFVEWPDVIAPLLPPDTIHLQLEVLPDQKGCCAKFPHLTNSVSLQIQKNNIDRFMEQRQKPVVSAGFTYSPLEETLDIPQKNSRLFIGIPKENSFQENRIALTPDAVSILAAHGHHIVVEHKAGDGSHYYDTDYSEAGAEIVYDKREVFKAEIIVKSAPLNDEEIELLHPHQIVISPIHLAALKALQVQKMMDKRITLLSFENLKDDAGTYPIVRAMSEIAGGAVMLIAGQYLSNGNKGKGILLGGITGIPPTKVVIIGAGIVGEFAARTAMALGASVKVFDNNIYKLKRLQNNIGVRVFTSVIQPKVLAEQLRNADVAVGALSSQSGRTPIVVTEAMVSNMKAGSVIVDVSIDRGGCFETSEITSHENPVFKKYDVVHYCVPNIPSGFARTASEAISNVLMPLLVEAADDGGFENLVWIKRGVRNGIYLYKGALTNYHLSEKFKLKYTDLELLLAVKG